MKGETKTRRHDAAKTAGDAQALPDAEELGKRVRRAALTATTLHLVDAFSDSRGRRVGERN